MAAWLFSDGGGGLPKIAAFATQSTEIATTEEFDVNTEKEITYKQFGSDVCDFELNYTILDCENESAANFQNKLNDDLKDNFSGLTL